MEKKGKQGDGQALSCKLTTPELRQRKKNVISGLKRQLLEKEELADGFAYQFAGSDSMIDLITDFVKTERLCREFFNFDIAITNDNSLWLTLTRPAGTKDFITSEIDL